MKIESVQASNNNSKNKNAKSVQHQDEFSMILSQTRKVAKGKTDEPEGKMIKSEETVDEEVESGLVDSSPLFLNISLFENKEINTIAFGEIANENWEVAINDVVQLTNVVEDIKVNNGNILRNQENISITTTEMLTTKENVIVESSSIIPELPKSKTLTNGKEPNILKEEDISNIDVKKYNLPIKDIPVQEKVVEGKQGDKSFIVEANDVVKGTQEEPPDLKQKDLSLKDHVLINTNAKEIGSTGLEPKINPPDPVISKENIQRVNDSIIQLMETTTEGDSSIMTVRLYPEELGSVNVTLRMEEGKLIAKILVDNDYVKQLFASKVSELQESLVKQNIIVQKVDIDLNSNQNPNLNQNNTNSNSKRDSNQNDENYSRRNRGIGFDKGSIDGSIADVYNVGSGAISILA